MIVPCPSCKVAMTLLHRKPPKHSFFYCRTCKIKHRAHPDGMPTGRPSADKETRLLRGEAHRKLNQVWDYSDPVERDKMYRWLNANSVKGHIGEMEKAELKKLISKIPKGGFIRESIWRQIGNSSTPGSR